MPQSLTDIVPLDELNPDGAIAETAEAAGIDRADFFKKAGLAGGSLIAAGGLMGALPQLAAAKSLPASDIAILNFALTLEYLERDFYVQATHSRFNGATKRFAKIVASHESTHVRALRKALGSKQIKSPKFNFHGTNKSPGKFRETSFALENTGVHAYLGQAGNIKTPAILLTAATIVTVEARHAAAIAQIMGNTYGHRGITPDGPFDKGYTKAHIERIVAGTHFIVK